MFISDEQAVFQQHHFIKRKLFKFAILALIIASLNIGISMIVKVDVLNKIIGSYEKYFYIIAFISALYIMWDRDTYLPFLGRTIIPCNFLKDSIPANATKIITINITKPNTKVLYWAADSSTNPSIVNNYINAYNDFSNSGVATSDKNGIIKLAVRDPQSYTVPYKGLLQPHVHFRICDGPGTLGRVKTIFLKDQKIVG
jgi:uncharacterized membrane protein YuzA (DUF378 family)